MKYLALVVVVLGLGVSQLSQACTWYTQWQNYSFGTLPVTNPATPNVNWTPANYFSEINPYQVKQYLPMPNVLILGSYGGPNTRLFISQFAAGYMNKKGTCNLGYGNVSCDYVTFISYLQQYQKCL